MARSLDDFTGIYTIKNGTGNYSGSQTIEIGYKVYIGTDSKYGDVESDGTRIGLAIVDGQRRVLPVSTENPIYAYLVDGTLNGSTSSLPGSSLEGEQLVFQVSLLTLQLPADQKFRAVSLLTVLNDPENAGVWGADDDSGG